MVKLGGILWAGHAIIVLYLAIRSNMVYNGPFQDYKETAMKVLAVIAKNPEAPPSGYEICEALKLGAGTVYPVLERLEVDEVIRGDFEPNPEENRPPRRQYRCSLPVWCVGHLRIFFPDLLENAPKLK